MKPNLWEFFEGEGGTLSMTRLLCFLAFFPATYVTVKLETESALTIFLGCYGLAYVLGKAGDALVMKAEGTKE